MSSAADSTWHAQALRYSQAKKTPFLHQRGLCFVTTPSGAKMKYSNRTKCTYTTVWITAHTYRNVYSRQNLLQRSYENLTIVLSHNQMFSRLSLWGHSSFTAFHPERELLWRFQPAAGVPSLGILRPWSPPLVLREVKALLIQLFFASLRSLVRSLFWCSSSWRRIQMFVINGVEQFKTKQFGFNCAVVLIFSL